MDAAGNLGVCAFKLYVEYGRSLEVVSAKFADSSVGNFTIVESGRDSGSRLSIVRQTLMNALTPELAAIDVDLEARNTIHIGMRTAQGDSFIVSPPEGTLYGQIVVDLQWRGNGSVGHVGATPPDPAVSALVELTGLGDAYRVLHKHAAEIASSSSQPPVISFNKVTASVSCSPPAISVFGVVNAFATPSGFLFDGLRMELEYPVGCPALGAGRSLLTRTQASHISFQFTTERPPPGPPFLPFLRFLDLEPPVFPDCPVVIRMNTTKGQPVGLVSWAAPSATDNRRVVSVVRDDAQPEATSFAIGRHTSMYTATDTFGNQATCLIEIDVEDAEEPVIYCKPSVLLGLSPNSSFVNLGDEAIMLDVQDNSGTATTKLTNGTDESPRFIALTVGSYIIEVEASDPSANKANCWSNVTVVDTIAPVFTSPCPVDRQAFVTNAAATTTINWTIPTAYDNGGLVPTTFSEPPSGSSFSAGNYTVVVYAVDASNNR